MSSRASRLYDLLVKGTLRFVIVCVSVFLAVAVAANSMAQIQDDPNDPTPETAEDGQPIHYAAQQGDLAAIARELGRGVDVNLPIPSERPRKDGTTPLHLAAAHADAATLRFLLEHGADPLLENGLKSIPLLNAAAYGDTERVRVLLDAGSPIDSQNSFFTTALMCATTWGDVERVELLLQRGARTDIADERDNTPLLYAARFAGPDIVRALLDADADPHTVCEADYTPVIMAARWGRIENLQLFESRGIDIVGPSSSGVTTLHAAAIGGDVPTIAYLLERDDIEIDLRHRVNGSTAIMLAAYYAGVDAVVMLLDAGADPSLKTDDSIVLRAAQSARDPVEKLRLFHERGFGLIDSDSSGRSPAHIAANVGNVEVLRLLIELKDDLSHRDHAGNTVLMWAARSDDAATIRFVIEGGAQPIDEVNEIGWTALMIAARLGKVESMNALFDAGADIDFRTSNGKTPLMIAAGFANLETVTLLVKRGADISIADENSQTALDYAASRDDEESGAIIELLGSH